jgi:hypothetical protein
MQAKARNGLAICSSLPELLRSGAPRPSSGISRKRLCLPWRQEVQESVGVFTLLWLWYIVIAPHGGIRASSCGI